MELVIEVFILQVLDLVWKPVSCENYINQKKVYDCWLNPTNEKTKENENLPGRQFYGTPQQALLANQFILRKWAMMLKDGGSVRPKVKPGKKCEEGEGGVEG